MSGPSEAVLGVLISTDAFRKFQLQEEELKRLELVQKAQAIFDFAEADVFRAFLAARLQLAAESTKWLSSLVGGEKPATAAERESDAEQKTFALLTDLIRGEILPAVALEQLDILRREFPWLSSTDSPTASPEDSATTPTSANSSSDAPSPGPGPTP